MALTEALIDFGEGEDVEEGVFDEGESFCILIDRSLDIPRKLKLSVSTILILVLT